MDDCYTIQTADHHNQLFSELHTLQKQGALCDVILAAEDGEVMAHKVVLMAVSKYFREKIPEFISSEIPRITLKGTSVVELASLVKYMYTGKLLVSKETLDVTLAIAKLLGLQGIMEGYKNIIMYEHMKQGLHSSPSRTADNGIETTGAEPSQQESSFTVEQHSASPSCSIDEEIAKAELSTTTAEKIKLSAKKTAIAVTKKGDKPNADWTLTEFRPDGTSVTYTLLENDSAETQSSSSDYSFEHNPYDKQYMSVSVGAASTQSVPEKSEKTENQSVIHVDASDFQNIAGQHKFCQSIQPHKQLQQENVHQQPQDQQEYQQQLYQRQQDQHQDEQFEIVIDAEAQHQDLLTVAIETLSEGPVSNSHRYLEAPAVQSCETAEISEETFENGKIVETKIVTLNAGTISNEYGGQTSVYTVALDPSAIKQPLKMPRILRKRTEKEKQAEMAAKKYRKKKAELMNSSIGLQFANLNANKAKNSPKILRKNLTKRDEEVVATDVIVACMQQNDEKGTSPENIMKLRSLKNNVEKCSLTLQSDKFASVHVSENTQEQSHAELSKNTVGIQVNEKTVGVYKTSITEIRPTVTRDIVRTLVPSQRVITVTSRPVSVSEPKINADSEENPSVIKIHVPSTVSSHKKTNVVGKNSRIISVKDDRKNIPTTNKDDAASEIKSKPDNGDDKVPVTKAAAAIADKVDSEIAQNPLAFGDCVRSSAAKRKGKIPRRLSLSAENTASVRVPIVRTRQSSKSEQVNNEQEAVAESEKKEYSEIGNIEGKDTKLVQVIGDSRNLRSNKVHVASSDELAAVSNKNCESTESVDEKSYSPRKATITIPQVNNDKVVPSPNKSKPVRPLQVSTRSSLKRKNEHEVENMVHAKVVKSNTIEINSDSGILTKESIVSPKSGDGKEVTTVATDMMTLSKEATRTAKEVTAPAKEVTRLAKERTNLTQQFKPSSPSDNEHGPSKNPIKLPTTSHVPAGDRTEKRSIAPQPGMGADKTSAPKTNQTDDEENKKVTSLEVECVIENTVTSPQCDNVPLPATNTPAPHTYIKNKGSSHQSDDSLMCDYCTQCFTDTELMKAHVHQEHQKEHLCDVCRQRFGSGQDLLYHMFTEHSAAIPKSAKRLKCPKCDLVAFTFKDMDAHLETHEDTRLINCTKCQKMFRTYLDLKKHMLIHKDKALQCNVCPFTTRQIASLRTHIRLQHSEATDEHTCQFCAYSTRLSGNLRKHLLAAHELLFVTKQSKLNRRKFADYKVGTLLMKDGTVFDGSQPIPKMSIRNFDSKKNPDLATPVRKKRQRGLYDLPDEEFTKELLKRHEEYLKEPPKDFDAISKNLEIATAHPSFPCASPSVRNVHVRKVYHTPVSKPTTTYPVTYDQLVVGNPSATHEPGQCHVIASEVEVGESGLGPAEDLVVMETVQEDGEVQPDDIQQVITISGNNVGSDDSEDQLLVINSEGKQSLIRTEDFYKSLMTKGSGVETSQTLEMITALLQAGEQIEIQSQADVEIQNM